MGVQFDNRICEYCYLSQLIINPYIKEGSQYKATAILNFELKEPDKNLLQFYSEQIELLPLRAVPYTLLEVWQALNIKIAEIKGRVAQAKLEKANYQ